MHPGIHVHSTSTHLKWSWDKFDCRVKAKQPTIAQHAVCRNSFHTVGEVLQVTAVTGDHLLKRVNRRKIDKAVMKTKCGYFEDSNLLNEMIVRSLTQHIVPLSYALLEEICGIASCGC